MKTTIRIKKKDVKLFLETLDCFFAKITKTESFKKVTFFEVIFIDSFEYFDFYECYELNF